MSQILEQSSAQLLDQSALLPLAERLVAAARRGGADAADAIAARSVSLSVDVRDAMAEATERAEEDSLGLRVFVGRRQAIVSTSDVSGKEIATLVERAIAMARAAPQDRYAGLADAQLLARTIPDLDLLDRNVPTVAELEQVALRAEAAGLAEKGVSKSGGASASAGISGVVLCTSHGFSGAYLTSRHGISMQAIAGAGTAMESDYDFSATRHATDLDRPEDVGRAAGQRAARRLNPRKVATCRVPVVFDPRLSGSLVGHLASAANGSAIARKTSFLRERLGDRIFAPAISIHDEPLRARGLRSHPFDAEGVGGERRAIVENGILRSWFLDCASARELGLVTTGHAQRGVSSTPSPSPSNLHMAPGSASPQELIRDITQGFYVTDLIGMGANIITGDYSRGAAGLWIENGELTYPVSEVTIAGHLGDMFLSLTPANDLRFRHGTNAPTVRVEGLTVAGV
ncbi:MAG: TldD/PmbA family protein [Proteobacteria bacterium]|nr:TldD/PmbA family protein [Pseudomonadota bacterium]